LEVKLKNILKVLGSGFMFYVIVAACASVQDRANDADGGIAGSMRDAIAGDGGLVDAILDAMGIDGARDVVNPVKKAEAAESGTRLKAKRYVAADGAKQFYGAWWDSMRSEDCYFGPAADGKIRCVPYDGVAGIWFANAACTTPLAYTLAGCTTPKYAKLNGATGTCTAPASTGPKTHAVMARHTGAVYTGTSASCTLVQPASLTAYDLYSIGAEVPASSFVEATLQNDP
jgi:hypothetical protein